MKANLFRTVIVLILICLCTQIQWQKFNNQQNNHLWHIYFITQKLHNFYSLYQSFGMEDDHLMDSFYITKPQFIHQQFKEAISSIQDIRQTCCQTPFVEAKNTISKLVLKTNHKPHLSAPQLEKSYQTISKQLYFSSSNSIIRRIKSNFSNKQIIRTQKQIGNDFNDKLQKILQQSTNILEKTAQNNRIPSQNGECDFERFDNFLQGKKISILEDKNIAQKKGKDYYERVKNKIQNNISHLLINNQKQKTKIVVTKNSSKKAAQKIKRQKGYLKGKSSKLKLSRSGLIITSSGEQKSLVASYGKLQDQKAKKDMIFKKCLKKNCQIVVQSVLKYQKAFQATDDLSKSKLKGNQAATKKYSIPSRRTISTDLKNPNSLIDKKQTLTSLQWKQKCLNIELTCHENYKSTPNLKKGISVFGKYCKRMNKVLKCSSQQIKNILIGKQQHEENNIYKDMTDILLPQ